jgi:hypothetical protein
MTDLWEAMGHQYICPTVTAEWLAPNVCLVRFLYSSPADYPYRGVVNVHVTGLEYEFKGMVFRWQGDAPTKDEHRAIKVFLARKVLIGKSRRLRNGQVVTKTYKAQHEMV